MVLILRVLVLFLDVWRDVANALAKDWLFYLNLFFEVLETNLLRAAVIGGIGMALGRIRMSDLTCRILGLDGSVASPVQLLLFGDA